MSVRNIIILITLSCTACYYLNDLTLFPGLSKAYNILLVELAKEKY